MRRTRILSALITVGVAASLVACAAPAPAPTSTPIETAAPGLSGELSISAAASLTPRLR